MLEGELEMERRGAGAGGARQRSRGACGGRQGLGEQEEGRRETKRRRIEGRRQRNGPGRGKGRNGKTQEQTRSETQLLVVAWPQAGRARLVPREGSSACEASGRALYVSPTPRPGRWNRESEVKGMGGRFGETRCWGSGDAGNRSWRARWGPRPPPLRTSERRLWGPLSVPAPVSHDVEQVTSVLGTPLTL